MNTVTSNNPPAPPNVLTVLRAAFDAITNHISILIFPVLVDFYIWLGPHIRIKQIILSFFDQLNQYPGWKESLNDGLLESYMEVINQLSNRINMMTLLRTYPIGIPSLMTGLQPITTPIYQPIFWDVTSLGAIFLIGIVLLVLGLAAGTMFYQLVAQVAFNEGMNLKKAAKDFPRAFIQMVLLVLGLIILIALVSIPASCLMSLIAVGGLSIGQFLIFLYIGSLIWILFPLILTPQSIILSKTNVINALKNSLSITRMTLPSTGLLFAVILLTSEGMDILWRIPEENSWFTVLGIFGHAFITTSLLASTFIYYRDAESWVQGVFRKILLSSATK
jgi:hypothetical protein